MKEFDPDRSSDMAINDGRAETLRRLKEEHERIMEATRKQGWLIRLLAQLVVDPRETMLAYVEKERDEFRKKLKVAEEALETHCGHCGGFYPGSSCLKNLDLCEIGHALAAIRGEKQSIPAVDLLREGE